MVSIAHAPKIATVVAVASTSTSSRGAGASGARGTFLPAGHRRMRGAVVCRASGGVEKPDVEALAKMAQMSVTPEEIKDWGPKIEGIVDWFGKLAEIDVQGVEPSLRAGEDENRFRQDAPVEYAGRKEIMAAVPDSEGVYLRVPKIMGESAD